MVPTPAFLHLAVALDGAGWHPAAWREPDAQPQRLFTAGYWTELARQAERGLLDFLTIEDGLDLQSDDRFRADSRLDRVRGRLDATLIAARTAPATSNIGFVPTAITTHTEPFHLSKAIATLDYVSSGRAGIRVQVGARADTAAHFGRREIPPLQSDRLADPDVQRLIADYFDEAADYVEVLRRLWDSWEDDAEIRDVATGRFIDRDKLHYIDFEGRWFSVKGPSITPRPPQGQPIIAALGHASVPYQLIARSADVGFVTPGDAIHAADIVTQIRAEQVRVGRAAQTVHVFGELVVFLDETETAAAARQQRLDERAGAEYRSDARVYTGTAEGLADLLQDWQAAGLSGFRLRPAALPHDLMHLTERLVPEDGPVNHWHTDVTFVLNPPQASTLRSITVPPYGGETLIANTGAAYRDLPGPLRDFAGTLQAVHANDYDYAVPPESLTDTERARRTVFISTRYETVHPVVRVHPLTGERGLFIGGFAQRIVGLSTGESRDILRLLQHYVTRPENVVRLSWEPGQLVLFDNRITQHYAIGNYDAPRRLNRVTVAGDIPVGIGGKQSYAIKGDASHYTPVADGHARAGRNPE